MGTSSIPNAASYPDFKPRMWSGDLNIALFSGDTLLGERDVGEATVFQMEAPSVEKAELKGKRRSNYGNTISSTTKSVTQEFSATLVNVNRENLVLALLGEGSAYTQSSGNDAAAVDVVITSLGLWYPLAKRNLSTTTKPVVTDDATPTPNTLTENEDYVIDYQTGRIMALPDGDITAGDTIKVTSTWLAITGGYKIEALANLNIYAQVRLIVNDEISDEPGELIIYKAQIEPSGALGWLTDEYQQIELKMTANDLSGKLWDFYTY